VLTLRIHENYTIIEQRVAYVLLTKSPHLPVPRTINWLFGTCWFKGYYQERILGVKKQGMV
jgi:hypothetical protein